MAQNDQPVKLSKAMFRAAALLPQAFGDFFDKHPVTEEIVGACALGAVLIADGFTELPDTDSWLNYFEERFDLKVTRRSVLNPVTNEDHDLYHTILYLNDKMRWPVRRIAAWLRSIGL